MYPVEPEPPVIVAPPCAPVNQPISWVDNNQSVQYGEVINFGVLSNPLILYAPPGATNKKWNTWSSPNTSWQGSVEIGIHEYSLECEVNGQVLYICWYYEII